MERDAHQLQLGPWLLLERLGRAWFVHRACDAAADEVEIGGRTHGRQRNLFPIGPLSDDELAVLRPDVASVSGAATHYINAVIDGLNFLYDRRSQGRRLAKRSAAQRRAVSVIIDAAVALASRLGSVTPRDVAGSWACFEAAGSQPISTLRADSVDVPDVAGTCNPLDLVPESARALIGGAGHVFSTVPADLSKFTGFFAGERLEYIRLCLRQLKAGLLSLSRSCLGGGTVFPVEKADGRQRVVWHGTRCSEVASRPPKPRHLANPSVLSFLSLTDGEQLRVSKRDCRTWFDQLVLPPELSVYMARPRIAIDELLDLGLALKDVDALMLTGNKPAGPGEWVFPVARTWPMGFSWSSYVAQETLLGILHRAGLDSAHALAEDTPLPASLDIAFALATDDAMFFSTAGVGGTCAATARFEHEAAAANAVLNLSKNVDDALDATCVGIELVDGVTWCPPARRISALLTAVLDLVHTSVASPGAVAGYLGITQWFGLLRRQRLSIFDKVYGFCSGSKATDWASREVPDAVLGELLLDGLFFAFGSIDMRLPHLDFVGATDASTCYGHGAAIANLNVTELQRIARLACKAGEYVWLDDGPELSESLCARLGPRHRLGLDLSSFQVVLSVPVISPQHINLEEGRALLQYIRWLLRSEKRFCHRVLVLLDSKVVLGAVAKGRSGSQSLNALLRQVSALCFAGNLVLQCVFVPTAHNPADWPSRGGPLTWPGELRGSNMQKIEERTVNKRLRRVNEKLKQERAQLEAIIAHGDDVLPTSQAGSIAQKVR